MQLAAAKSKAAPQRSISAVAAPPAAEASPNTAEQAAAGKTQASPRRLVTAVREKAHEKVAVPFVPVTLVCKDLRYYVPGKCCMKSGKGGEEFGKGWRFVSNLWGGSGPEKPTAPQLAFRRPCNVLQTPAAARRRVW